MLFLGFILEEKELTWLTWIERPLEKIGKLDQLEIVLASALLVVTAEWIAPTTSAPPSWSPARSA